MLGADRLGRWIIKARWSDVETGEAAMTEYKRELPDAHAIALYDYVQVFEAAGLCVDWMPSNVVFRGGRCGTFETSVWDHRTHAAWNFRSCFLPAWLPDGPPEASLVGFPPYPIPSRQLDNLRKAWYAKPSYGIWRSLFGDFPELSPEWWRV
jgi:hypothetical protein